MARVVVIEDEPDLLELITEELTDLGHEVHSAQNGVDGLNKIMSLKPNVICSDINMPKMNGFRLKSALDEQGFDSRSARFIFISAQTDSSEIADGLMLGADFYITKPVDFKKLAEAVGDAS